MSSTTQSEVIKAAGNAALQLNKPTGLDLHITAHGSDWLWTCFSIFGVLLFYNLIYLQISKTKKLLHGIALIPILFEFIAYFTMASDLGWAGVVLEFHNVKVANSDTYVRQVFYAKYIAWVFSFPAFWTMIDISSSEVEKIKFDTSFIVHFGKELLSCWLFAVCLLIGTLIHSTYKWGYFVFALFGECYALGSLFQRIIVARPGRISIIFISLLGGLVWLLYLVSWGLSEGGNVIQSDSELVFYGILDLVQFGFIPLVVCLFTKLEHSFALELPERIIEKQQIVKHLVESSDEHSGETAIHSHTPTPKPEGV